MTREAWLDRRSQLEYNTSKQDIQNITHLTLPLTKLIIFSHDSWNKYQLHINIHV